MKKNLKEISKTKKITIILLILFLIIIPFSFAVFVLLSNTESTLPISLETVDNKSLVFNSGDPISLYVEAENFVDYGTDIVATTNPSVILTSKIEESDNYEVFLKVYYNTFLYSVGEDKPELLLNIYDENGDEVTSVEGIDYIVNDDISAFDITGIDGLFTIALDNDINVNASSTIHEWTFKVTFRSLVESQNQNLGANFSAQICLAQDEGGCNFPTDIESLILLNNGGAENIESKGQPNFNVTATTNEGMYAVEDNGGTSYYFRGAVDNNWVKFAGFYWRIIRIEGTGAVKLIYSGTTAPTESESVVMTGTGTQLSSTSKFNNSYNSTVYAGYVYQTGVLHGTSTNSTVKTAVDAWYNNNLSSYSSYLTTTNYCIDRVIYDRSGESGSYIHTKLASQVVSTSVHFYGAYSRLGYVADEQPNLECEDSGDVLSLSVGLIGADEVALAGGLVGTDNSSYYLYTNSYYWTLSPCYFYSNYAFVFYVASTGNLYGMNVNGDYGVRPSVSLKSSISVSSGNGTWDNPYVIA